jgi:hypothetical protein
MNQLFPDTGVYVLFCLCLCPWFDFGYEQVFVHAFGGTPGQLEFGDVGQRRFRAGFVAAGGGTGSQ